MTGAELDRSVKRELRTLSKDNAAGVAAHLVMVGRLLDTDPEAAQAHAETAARRAGRVAAVREIRGLVAYRRGDWALALSELRTARRLSGSHHLLPLMVDAERGLGRLDRALELASAPESLTLDRAERIELAIVVSGIRRDLGQNEAALVVLRGPELDPNAREPWTARLLYAYAESLLAGDDVEEARAWFAHAAAADTELRTDAAERLDEIDGVVLTDLLEGEDSDAPAPSAASIDEEGRVVREELAREAGDGPALDENHRRPARQEATDASEGGTEVPFEDAVEPVPEGVGSGVGDEAAEEATRGTAGSTGPEIAANRTGSTGPAGVANPTELDVPGAPDPKEAPGPAATPDPAGGTTVRDTGAHDPDGPSVGTDPMRGGGRATAPDKAAEKEGLAGDSGVAAHASPTCARTTVAFTEGRKRADAESAAGEDET